MAVVDPQVQKVLAMFRKIGLPDFCDVSVAEARKWMVALAPPRDQLPAIHSVTDLTIPGPAGQIAVRVYRPSAAPGLPVLV